MQTHISQFIFLISKEIISCGFSKELSQEDDSFEHQKNVGLTDMKIFTVLRGKNCLSGPMVCNVTGP